MNGVNIFYSENRIQVLGINASDNYELKIFDLFVREVQDIKDNNIVNLTSSIYIVKIKIDGKGIKTGKILVN